MVAQAIGLALILVLGYLIIAFAQVHIWIDEAGIRVPPPRRLVNKVKEMPHNELLKIEATQLEEKGKTKDAIRFYLADATTYEVSFPNTTKRDKVLNDMDASEHCIAPIVRL